MKRFKKTAIILSVAMLTMGILSVPAFAEEPAPASETAETVSIGFGSTGEEVANIQTALIAFGFLDSVADGDFGNVTKAAVEAFQQAYGLEVTGTMTENDIAVLTGATSIVPAGGTQPTGEPADRFGVGLATICIYPDGTMWAEPDTVSNRALDTVDQILLAVTAAYNGSDSIPEYDTGFLITIAEGETGVPEVLNGKETVSLDELAALAAVTGESITLTDNLGNVITAQPDGTITSSTGVIAVAQVRMDTNEVIQETAGRNIEDLNWKNPNELWIGGTKLVVQEDGTFTADPNTVSKQTLDKVRALYSAGQYAFANSETIPADESEIDPANLPDGLTEADVAYNDATGGYYVRQDAIDRAEQETGTKIELPNTSLVTPTRFDQSGQTSQEEEQAKEETTTQQNEQAQQTQNNTQTNTQPSWENTQQAQAQYQPQQTTQAYVPEPVTQAPVQAQPQAQPQTEHQHTWEPMYTTVHHDAVTHQEPVYTTVWHDAVTHEEPVYEQVPIYESISYYVCTACGRRSDEFASLADFGMHQFEDGGSSNNMQDTYISGYENRQTGTRTVTDSEGYNEQVIDHYETVTDSAAWDEQVISGYRCSSCGATQ